MKVLLKAALVASALLAPRSASAVTLADPGTKLTLDVALEGADVCSIVPPAPADAGACAGLDLAAMDKALRAQRVPATGVALARYEDFEVAITMVPTPGVALVSAEQIAELVAQIRAGASSHGSAARTHGAEPGSPYDLVSINGADAVRFHLEVDAAADAAARNVGRSLLYAFPGPTSFVVVSFASDAAHAEDLKAVAEMIIKTAKMPPSGVPGFGKARPELLGHTAKGVAAGVGAVALIVAVVLAARKKTKEQAAEPPG